MQQTGIKRENDYSNSQNFDASKKMKGEGITLRFLLLSKVRILFYFESPNKYNKEVLGNS